MTLFQRLQKCTDNPLTTYLLYDDKNWRRVLEIIPSDVLLDQKLHFILPGHVSWNQCRNAATFYIHISSPSSTGQSSKVLGTHLYCVFRGHRISARNGTSCMASKLSESLHKMIQPCTLKIISRHKPDRIRELYVD